MAKLCFIASSGGHLTEITKLKELTKLYDSFLVTEKVENSNSTLCDKKYFVSELNRNEKFFLFKLLNVCLKECLIFLKERPDFVISTGALCSYPMIRIAKFFKRKIIFIESYARINEMSLTGKKVYRFADLFIVQWKELKEKYPKAVFVGSLFGD